LHRQRSFLAIERYRKPITGRLDSGCSVFDVCRKQSRARAEPRSCAAWRTLPQVQWHANVV